ncbi:MAG TPA: mechanosensitive ion channel domain-containing protein [Chloroflexota bacterium]|nr:mechanosensitive ion channel domain-containing protein [Chloroflexota bacterium]
MTIDPTFFQDFLAAGWLQVLRALLVVLVAVIGLRVAHRWAGSIMQRARVDTGTQILVKRGLAIAVVAITLLVVLGILGVNSVSLVTVAGAVGLAFSLAIQDILKNFFAGVYLLLERPFRVGDTIQVKDQLGVVENIGVRTTTLRTPDNVQVLVPNTVVFAEVVSNHTYQRPAVPTPAPADDQGSKDAVTEQASAAVVKRS